MLLVVLSFSGSLDKLSESYTQDAFNRALLTYGIARAINGVISVAQGTEVAVQPAGFGVNFAPGQILDPVNDLVERFSLVMLAATASLGIQQVFITISSSFIVRLSLSALLILLVFVKIREDDSGKQISKILQKLLLVILFIRFAVPVTAIASEAMYRYFLAEQYTHSAQQLEQTKIAIGEINTQANTGVENDANKSFMDRAADLVSSATSSMDIGNKIDQYKEAVEGASYNAIKLIVVFVVHTVLFPLLFLWVSVRLLKEVKFN